VEHPSDLHAKRVLVVDDNEDIAEMTAELLKLHGYVVAIAPGGLQALDLATAFCPDVAILDIGLPDMDGYELACSLRSTLKACRLVAVTGFAQAENRARAADAGFAAHLVKPVSAAEILAALESPVS